MLPALSLGTAGNNRIPSGMLSPTYGVADAAGKHPGFNEVNTGVNTGAIYNLNGVRVNNMTKKGVYIVNGKKFVVK